jgi:hypothetical protein
MGFNVFPLSSDASLRQHAAGLCRHPACAANIVSGQRARQEPRDAGMAAWRIDPGLYLMARTGLDRDRFGSSPIMIFSPSMRVKTALNFRV